ncbi:hypothetical protein Prede_1827 [Prevotella dentalis DSM 3688]|nr:hypothetical protein [Prevotella dentalis]AGB29113.1 hypothetical protein Prede_1827 [Prevotella dentalis DSM 3688]
MKTKTTNIIQRLCLFLFVLVLAAPAWATDYGREGYETFRSRELGKHQKVTTLRKGKVEVWFSNCHTTGGTGNSAIYELAKGSRINVEVDDGYAIRWIILRDTEGGEDYDESNGIKRISSVTSGYDYYFERNAISNSGISGANQNNLNDDDNNIVVYNYDASARSVNIYTHNNSRWGQFKVRDIIVGYVKVPKVRFEKDSYDVYTVSNSFMANLDKGEYDGNIEYYVDNNEIADVNNDGSLKLKRPGTVGLTAIFPSNEKFAKAQCGTTINVKRDRVTFNYQVPRPKVLYYQGDGYANAIYNLYDYSDFTTESGIPYNRGNDGFNVECTNSDVLSIEKTIGRCFFERTAGTVTVTMNQRENNLYAESSLRQTFTVIRTDKGANTMLIKDLNEWKVFAHLVNDEGVTNLNARLEADIDLGSDITMVGTYDHKYSGTFDGQNHTLTLNWDSGATSDIAPFKKVDGATIKNLRTQGTIKSSSYYLSGLIDEAYGKTSVSNCVSNVNITSSYTNDRCGAAGMISYIGSSGNITITDCLVKGSINASGAGRRGMGGFVYSQNGTCTLTNCLYAGTNNVENNGERTNTFAYNATTDNCHYLNPCGKAQGTKVTTDQLKNGEVAYQLQKSRNEQVWGQTIGTNNEPQLIAFDNSAKKVYQVNFTYKDQVKATRYANSGKTVSLPTTRDIVGSSYNEHHYYTIAFTDNFNENTTVTGDKQVTVSITEKDAYEIGSADEWNTFSNLVIKGENGLDAKLTADIDLGVYFKMVGDYYHPYFGTFDGQGHTLTMNWDSGNDQKVGVFNYVKDCTIKNLRLEGKITANADEVGGLIYSAKGNSTISGCVSNLQITNKYKDGRMSGLISVVFDPANVTINDCIVKGDMKSMNREGNKDIVGFVKRQYDKCTLNNCLYIGTNNADSQWARTFCNNANLNNCYYLNPCGTAQGTQITEEQLKNGEVAHLLQNGRDTQFWGQKLGTDNEPMPTTDEAKHIYKVDFAYNNEVKATRYATRNNAIYGDMPTFTAQGLMGSDYNEHHYYTLAFAEGFNGSTTVDADRTVAINLTEKDYYEIASKDNWIEFSNIVYDGQNAVDAKMTADVDLGGDFKTIGGVHKYSGTFDGQGHTLTVNWAADNAGLKAPFGYVDGATIKNLRTKGKIQGNYGLAGLIYSVYGNTTVSDCVSEVDIKGAHGLAGMIYRVNSNAKVTMTDCVVKGDLTATTEDGKKQMVGFIYDIYGGNTLTNCLYIGTNNATAGNTFAFGANATNCYYLNACGRVQGTQVTEEQLKNGAVAYKLQNGRDTQFWGQTLGTDNEPRLIAFDNSAKKVYQVAFTYNNEVRATRYANSGKTVSLPTIKDFMGTGYNPHHYYTIAFAGGFNGSTTVDADRTVTVTLTEKDCYDIASKEDWRAFRELVNEGQTAVDAKLTQDVNLGEEILMLGYYLPNVYSGTFDGQGHTLSFSWDAGSRNEIAPFKNVKDATIRNLRTQGKITSSSYDSQLSGLINYAYGNTTISGCVSEVDLKGRISLAGILQWPDDTAHITINDCLVKGNFHATSDLNGGTSRTISGFIAHRHKDAACTLNNCLYLGTSNALDHDKTSHTFSSDFELNEGTGFTRINNCYYLNACGEVQGDRVTAEQLKSGEVAKLLQADRTDQCYWAQPLGEEPSPYRETGKAEANYVYYNKENNSWVCDDFRLTDGTAMPIGLDFTAATVTYERNFNGAQKATLCLPYELSVQGFKAYTISGGNGSAVYFAEAKDKLEAYKPYLITVDGVPQLGGENIEVKAFNDDKLTTPAGKYKFVGTVTGVDNATAAAANAYILQDDGKFHKVTTDNPAATVPAYRAYVTCPKGAGAKQLSIVIDGETTGIGGATNDARGRADGPVYDLQGRRVADRLDAAARHRLPAGVYIVGGRKVILK